MNLNKSYGNRLANNTVRIGHPSRRRTGRNHRLLSSGHRDIGHDHRLISFGCWRGSGPHRGGNRHLG